MYFQRTLEDFFKKAQQNFPVLLITGARQVGKTTFLKHQITPERTYVTLDDPVARELANREPALFLERFKPPILIDEIQYAPHLFSYIKMIVDEQQKPNLFWLTGSQPFHLMKNVSESLAGRVGIIHLLGLSSKEMNGLPQYEPFLPNLMQNSTMGVKEIYERIWRGAFPAIVTHPEMDHNLFYSSYVQTYLQRDVRDLTHIGNELTFMRFLRAAAARTGQILNMTDLARDVDISPHTAKQWLSILEASGIIYLLQPFFTNITKRIIKAPKLYFLDTGLVSYLTNWSSPETLETGAMSGAILETWILVEILKSYWHNGQQLTCYYYRDKEQKEIDLLIEKNGTLYPLEFKKTASPHLSHVASFKALERLNQTIGLGGLVCFSSTALPLTKDVNIIPIGSL